MYKNFKPQRNKNGEITRAAPYQERLPTGHVSRVQPDRRWFGNSRTIPQSALQKFQEELGKLRAVICRFLNMQQAWKFQVGIMHAIFSPIFTGKAFHDPYKFVLKPTKMPVTLLNEAPAPKNAKVHVLDTEPFKSTFGPKAKRKVPLIRADSMQDLADRVTADLAAYEQTDDTDIVRPDDGVKIERLGDFMRAGQSKRIWNELYKVIDSSDILLQVLDARDPLSTRSRALEKHLKVDKPFKHLVFVLNKADLVPAWVTKRWIMHLSREYPTLAFCARLHKPFGKSAILNLLRQFTRLHADKKQISVGIIGFPNVGKSSLINALKAEKVCNVAPIAGETKVWQYIKLMDKISLIDCPGVTPPAQTISEDECVLNGVVRVEKVAHPEWYIPALLSRTKKEYIQKCYDIADWTDANDFLRQLARKSGKLLRKGEPDLENTAKKVLNDWQRGKIPYFVAPPPLPEGEDEKTTNADTGIPSTPSSLLAESLMTEEVAESVDFDAENDAEIVESEITE